MPAKNSGDASASPTPILWLALRADT